MKRWRRSPCEPQKRLVQRVVFRLSDSIFGRQRIDNFSIQFKRPFQTLLISRRKHVICEFNGSSRPVARQLPLSACNPHLRVGVRQATGGLLVRFADFTRRLSFSHRYSVGQMQEAEFMRDQVSRKGCSQGRFFGFRATSKGLELR